MGKWMFRAARAMVKPVLILIIVLVIAHSVATFVLAPSICMRTSEQPARNLRAVNDALAEQRHRVSESWTGKLFPDF